MMSHHRASSPKPGSSGQPPADIFDRIDSAVLVIDDHDRVRYANAPAVPLLGRPRSEIVGASLGTLLPPSRSFLGNSCVDALINRQTTTTFGWDAFIEAWVGIRIYPMTTGMEVHIRTIPSSHAPATSEPTERANIAVSLDTVTIPMQIIDSHGVVRFANQALLDLLGYLRDEYVGRPMAEVFPEPEHARMILDRLARSNGLHDFETELLQRDGQVRTVLITTGAHDSDASADFAQCYLRDITEQRVAEERDAWLAAFVESSDDAIITKRLDGVITSWNRGAERIYGYTAEEAVGQPVTLIIPDDREDEFPEIMSRLARGEHIDHYETVRLTKDGRLLDISASISPIRNRSGRIIGAATIARDITEHRMLERKQREFLTMVAHDLRSPLTSIKGFAQLMQRRETYSPAGITAILNQVRHMERLVGDVLDLTRLDEHRQELMIAEVNLVDIALSVTESAGELLQSGTVRLVAPSEPLIGRWDKDRIAQILDNLVSNGVKYAPNSDVTVTLARNDDHVTMEVTDEGPGIDAEHLPYIFDRFYRTPGEHAMGRGVGLGLAITRGLVEAHGGQIEVESTVGVGTTFRVTLPWAAPNQLPAAIA